MLFHLWFHSPDSILYTIGACRGLDHPGDGRAALTGLSAAPVSCQCNARGPKTSHFFRRFCERELLGGKESGFYGGLLCFPHCASLRRDPTDLGRYGGTKETSDVWEPYSAWALVRWQHSFGELGKGVCLGSDTLGCLVMGQQQEGPVLDISWQTPGL